MTLSNSVFLLPFSMEWIVLFQVTEEIVDWDCLILLPFLTLPHELLVGGLWQEPWIDVSACSVILPETSENEIRKYISIKQCYRSK